MARVKAQINQKAIDRYFASDPGALAALGGVALGLKEVCVQASPVGTSRPWPDPVTGPYNVSHGQFKASWGVRRFRHWYRVVNTDPFAAMVEYGTARNPVYAPTRRALRSVSGGKVIIFGKGQHLDRIGVT